MRGNLAGGAADGGAVEGVLVRPHPEGVGGAADARAQVGQAGVRALARLSRMYRDSLARLS